MPVTQKKREKVEDKQEEKLPDLSGQIAVSLIKQMGRPKNLHQIRVSHLWRNNYRVNVWVDVQGDQPISDQRRISDSYFVTCNEVGDIVSSRPEIVRRYSETGEDMQPETKTKKSALPSLI